MLTEVGQHFEIFRSARSGVRLHLDAETRNASELEGLQWSEVQRRLLYERISLVLQAEHLNSSDPLRLTQRALEPLVEVIGANVQEASTHYYLSGRNATAMGAHDDRYDVVVLHMAGEKRWTTCVPKATEQLPASLNDAERALLRVVQQGKGACQRGGVLL
jgi:hypothetical protein